VIKNETSVNSLFLLLARIVANYIEFWFYSSKRFVKFCWCKR